MTGGRPAPSELWQQAGGNAGEYRRLMREHGHLVPGKPEPLPCGWPGESRGCPCVCPGCTCGSWADGEDC